MTADSDERRLMTAYLLGTLPEEERARVSERALTEGDFFARLREVEDDLIDALASGELEPRQAASVNRFLAETNQLDRLRTAQALHTHLGRTRLPIGRRRNLWLIAAALIIATGAVWWYRLAVGSTARQADTGPAAASTGQPDAVLSIFLPAGVLRGERRMERVTIPRGTALVRIDLETNPLPEMTLWRVELRMGSGAPVYTQSAAFSSGPVELIAPARLLGPGHYEATLSVSRDGAAWETAGYYYFTVL